jgi:uncharacterized protein YkwD
MRTLRLLLIATLFTAFTWSVAPPAEASVQGEVSSAISPSTPAERILADTNAARASVGLPAVAADPVLDVIAQTCSETQAHSDVIAHCDGYYTHYPMGWTSAAENVAAGYAVDAVVAGWMDSPGHRANILNPTATHIGIGYAVSASGTTYFTQDFASYPPSIRP